VGVLFVGYINTFLILKAEARGYPGWVHSPEDEERYVKSFWRSEGMRLQKEAITEYVSGGPKNYAYRVLATVTGTV